MANLDTTCSFCGRSRCEAGPFVEGSTKEARICGDCVGHAVDALVEDAPKPERPRLGPVPSPVEIFRHLNQHVVGQENAKKKLAIATRSHFLRLLDGEANLVGESLVDDINLRDVRIEKSNILLIGPTGVGKTLLARTLAKKLDVPLAIGDATSLTETGYVGQDCESLLLKLLINAGSDIEIAQRGVVFLDEVDKIATASGSHFRHDATDEGVQQCLLKMLEGTSCTVQTHGGRTSPEKEGVQIDTTNILFICGGAFVGLDDIISKRLGRGQLGFGRRNHDEDEDALQHVLPEDMIRFGMIPELVGRLPVITTLDELDVTDLERILVEPRDALLKQFQKLAAFDGVHLQFTDDAIHEIAVRAMRHGTGARGLRSIVEQVVEPVLFESTKYRNKKVVISDEVVRGEKGPTVLNRRHRRQKQACA